MLLTDDQISLLFVTAWRRASPTLRHLCPIMVAEGLVFEPYLTQVPVLYGGKRRLVDVTLNRLWVVPMALYRRRDRHALMRLTPVQRGEDTFPMPVPIWSDEAALPWLGDIAQALARATLSQPAEPVEESIPVTAERIRRAIRDVPDAPEGGPDEQALANASAGLDDDSSSQDEYEYTNFHDWMARGDQRAVEKELQYGPDDEEMQA